MMKKNIYYIIAILLLTCNACSNDFLKEYSQDLARVKTASDLNELLMGDCTLPLGLFSYSDSYFSKENPNYAVLHFMGDELKENIDVTQDPDHVGIRDEMFPYYTWQKNTYLDYLGKDTKESSEEVFWNLAYNKIGNCNMVIDEAEKLSVDNDNDETLRRHVIGEASFLRADYYLMLVNLYAKPYMPATATTDAGVPLKISSKVEDLEYKCNSVAEIYAQILKDLNSAELNLKDVTVPKSIYHVGINAAYLLYSRVYLYMQDWENAKKYATLSMQQNSSLQNLLNWDPSSFPISDTNPEVIYSNGSSCLGNMLFVYPGHKVSSYDEYTPTYCISDHLMSLYTDNDARLKSYISKTDDKTYGRPAYHKIDDSMASYSKYKTVSDVFCLRSAEAYLNLAEADAHLEQNVEACAVLNQLRAARISGATDISLKGLELVKTIREERERELCLEGHRWFDLRRYQVDVKYPYTTTIEHTFSIYGSVYKAPKRIDYYRLEKNDAAYTLNIPKTVRDFQISIGSNERPARVVFKSTTNEEN